MASSSTWIISLKVLLISTSVVLFAMAMKVSVPLIVDFVVNEVPVIWSTVVSLLKPPYLYFVINGIIITIAASSRFHHKFDNQNQSELLVQETAPPSDLQSDFHAAISAEPDFSAVVATAVFDSEPRALEVKPVLVNVTEIVGDGGEGEDEFVISKSTWTPPQRISSSEIQTEDLFPTMEKPLVSSRFGHRKPVKTSPEGGRTLRVAKPKRQETLESTWKTITEGRHMPLTRHLRKTDTWETRAHHFNTDQSLQQVKKSETFKDHTNSDNPPTPPSASTASVSSSPGSGKLRKEPSLSHDELNRRVEAFIKKFNDEMRLQRQESLNQYMEMINRGAH